MSWMYGHTGPRIPRSTTGGPFPQPLQTISFPGFFMTLGGIAETCHVAHDAATSSGWAVVGTGILTTDSGPKLMKQEDWSRVLGARNVDVSSLDGHFVAIVWKNGEVRCFTDQLGLRPFYFTQQGQNIFFSTRLDWLSSSTNTKEIDFPSLGSRWLLVNQMSLTSCIKGIERLGPGGYASFADGRISGVRHTPWLPEFGEDTLDPSVEKLRALLDCAHESGWRPSLGLSGGFDSRLLLAILNSDPDHKTNMHTFGNAHDPDVCIAKDLAQTLNLRHTLYDNLPLSNHPAIDDVQEFAAAGNLMEPVTATMRYQFYGQLHQHNTVVIDGGFGELSRRQYLKKAAMFGKAALLAKDASRLIHFMRVNRESIFSRDVTETMQTGAIASVAEALEEMPPAATIGVENFADLFMLRTRVPNFGGSEQARLDTAVLNFMPFVQPSYLRAMFRGSVRQRRNGAFYRALIRRLEPRLCRVPLAKSGLQHPFGLTGKSGWLYTKVHHKFSRPYVDPFPVNLLQSLREFVLDISHDHAIKNLAFYDSPHVAQNVERYYAGGTNLQGYVEWWLTFELWRRSL